MRQTKGIQDDNEVIGGRKLYLEENGCALHRDLLAQHCVTSGITAWSY